MFAGVLATTHLLWRWDPYRERLPAELQSTRPGLVGTLLGASVVVGELPNSFLKRQLEIAPGERLRSPAGVAISLFDQADFVLTAWLLLRPVYRMSLREAMGVSLTVTAVHVPINVLGRIREIPEICSIFCATANPVEVIVAESEHGRGILGVIDGSSPKGIEADADIEWRHGLLRKIGYKR